MITSTRLAAALAVSGVLGLAGCSGGGEPGGSSLGLALFGNPQNVAPARPAGPEPEYSCPSVEIQEGAAAYRAGGGEVAWQAALQNIARECVYQGSQFVLRVGVEGRVLIGPAGRGGAHAAPLRITVLRGDKVVASRLARVGGTLSLAQPSVAFMHVEEGIALPMTADPGDDYSVLVGFDSGGAGRAGRR